ncbi:MAG TPA: DNA-3-methyladenine glycosylase [Actinomycetota bacterium]
MRPLARAFYARPVLVVARDVIGCILVHDTAEGRVAGQVVEAEAYGQEDPGSHAFRGRTPRTAPMFERPGHAYVYFTYGMHFCFNIVCEREGVAGAVLIRAVEPLEGIELMRARRGPVADRDLARGPARLTQAFGIARAENRSDLTRAPLHLAPGERLPVQDVVETPRIGLGRSQDGRRWRFAVRDNRWVSGPRRLQDSSTD